MVTERKVRVVGVVICFRLVPQYVIWILLYLYLPLPFSYIIHKYVLTSGENHFLVLVSCEVNVARSCSSVLLTFTIHLHSPCDRPMECISKLRLSVILISFPS